jgi:hypothetical protein
MSRYIKGIWPVVLLALFAASCKKDKTPDTNTWQVTPDAGKGTEVYKLKTSVLRINIKYVLEVQSEENASGGNNGVSSTLVLSFLTVGPPPTGTYKVTAYEKLTSADQVAVYVMTSKSPSNTSLHTSWFSQEGGNQTISYQFENGKASATFNDIVIKQAGSPGPTTGKISAKISQ